MKILRAELADGSGDPGVIDGVRVGTGEGMIELLAVQPEGKGSQDARAWRNGAHASPGERLG
jgi:methionyl-tRNA formyltransferase